MHLHRTIESYIILNYIILNYIKTREDEHVDILVEKMQAQSPKASLV